MQRKFRVLIYGRNFRLAFQEGRRTVVRQTGIYTWRNVIAVNSRQAENRAIQMIRGDARLRKSVRNRLTDPPIMRVVKIERLDRMARLSKSGTGYTFFHGKGAGRPRTGRTV